ncbi:MAG: hypothetical protein BVN33_17165 [Proteobacteria bacterium ST_bin13]|nr:MAG: hypothetical protein BVN33_17165 [Proteobacteria bacterium ST_bin13]
MIIDRRSVLGAAMAIPALPALARAPVPGALTGFVDPFIGTDGTGHCFPGPSRPFGMVQPGPDNAGSGWDFTSGYQYRAPKIMGFSQTRASGTGIPELGDILLQPVLDPRDDVASRYDKASEVARPGYYAVTLADNGAKVELTCGLRTALHRYRFARGGRVWVLVDTEHRLRFLTKEPVDAASVRTTATGAEGSITATNWTKRTIAFALEFDHPVAEVRPLPSTKAPRYLLGFDLGEHAVLQAKVAVSTTDVAGARANLAELPGWDFDAVARAADTEWEKLLGRIRIDADARTKRIFYTALYHLFLQPSIISDADGRYRGPTGQIAKARGQHYYSTLSLWDTFRAAHPLYTLLIPERVNDFVLTLLDHAKAAGTLPLWPIWGGETNTMIGDPALPVIADAWAKGFRGFDGQEALAAMRATSTTDHAQSDWSLFDRYGYYPTDKLSNEAVSRTLEAGIGDAATAKMAAMLGDTESAKRFGARANGYRALIDPETKLARGKDSKGAWRTPFDPLTATSPLNNPGDYTEANAWQYSWTPALHDVDGLVAAMGGRAAFTNMLDTFFSLPGEESKFLGQEALIGQYAHGNEPSHHIAWLYAWSDRPERGPELVREIATRFYKDTPDGIVGNDDCGQMSAWYIFATLGFYPVNPTSGDFVLGQPLVAHATVSLPKGKTLAIAQGKGGSVINGEPLTRTIAYRALMRGGVLRLSGAEANHP